MDDISFGLAMGSATTELTLAMLHFVQPAPRPSSAFVWTLWPQGRRLSRAALCDVLESMPRPVLISAHANPGALTAISLAEVPDDTRPKLEWECTNQMACLTEMLAAVHPGSLPSHVLLELPDRELIISGEDLVQWAHEYAVTTCGWRLSSLTGDQRATVRMLLLHPNGDWSPGDACEPRTSAT